MSEAVKGPWLFVNRAWNAFVSIRISNIIYKQHCMLCHSQNATEILMESYQNVLKVACKEYFKIS